MSNELGTERQIAASERTRLRAAIAEMLYRHSGRLAEPKESAVARVAAAMPGHDGGERRAGKDYDLVAERLTDELQRDETISLRHARDGAWCLWETKPAIAHADPLLGRYLKQLLDFADKRASRALCNAYLVQYEESRPGLEKVSQTLEKLADFAEAPYAGLQRELKLFSLPEGPERLGSKALESRRKPSAELKEYGLSSAQLLQGGFVEPCARAALEQVAGDRGLKPRERLDFVMELAVKAETGKLEFEQHKAAFANALLLPYANTDPPEDVKAQTLNILTKLLGDPRTNPWMGMDKARAVILRWLTRLALRQFLDVVETINPDPNWKYRRKFWEAMYEHQAIGNAWTVLSSVGINEARRRFGTNTPYGEFVSGRVAPDHAVLLMEVGNGICAEWSYNGRCRFWAERTRKGSPQMFQPTYDADFLRTGKAYAPIGEITHSPHKDRRTGEKTAWQHRVAKRIYTMAGVRVPERDYMWP